MKSQNAAFILSRTITSLAAIAAVSIIFAAKATDLGARHMETGEQAARVAGLD